MVAAAAAAAASAYVLTSDSGRRKYGRAELAYTHTIVARASFIQRGEGEEDDARSSSNHGKLEFSIETFSLPVWIKKQLIDCAVFPSADKNR